MNEFFNWLTQPYALLFCFVLLFLLFIVPLYIRVVREFGDMEKKMQEMESIFTNNFKSLLENNAAERAADREEMGNNLRGMSDSVVRIMGEISRTQQQQLDSFGGQIRAMNRTDEERMDKMRTGIGEKLQDYDRQMTRVTQVLDEKFTQNDRRWNEMQRTLTDGLFRIQGEIERRMDGIRETVDEKLNATVDKRLGESFRSVSARLDQVFEGLGEMQTLAVGVEDLKRVLTTVKTRGVWGEVQLGSLLDQVLTTEQYAKNIIIKLDDGEPVEYAILLPGQDERSGPVYLPIDSKFPSDDYQRLLDAAEAGSKDAEEEAARALEATIRSEARRIRMQYIDPPHTTDFAIMFLPVEGLFAEVLKRNGIVEQLQTDFRVVLTGPTTLLALLNSLQMGFRTIAIERRSNEVWELLGAVKSEFGRFADLLSRTQQRLNMATASIEDAARKTRTIQRRLQSVKELSEQEATRLIDTGDEEESVAADAVVSLGATAEEGKRLA